RKLSGPPTWATLFRQAGHDRDTRRSHDLGERSCSATLPSPPYGLPEARSAATSSSHRNDRVKPNVTEHGINVQSAPRNVEHATGGKENDTRANLSNLYPPIPGIRG